LAGVETKLVWERLGHSSTAITSDVYTHVPVAMQDDAARRVAACSAPCTPHQPGRSMLIW
jgi:hypothetical protein